MFTKNDKYEMIHQLAVVSEAVANIVQDKDVEQNAGVLSTAAAQLTKLTEKHKKEPKDSPADLLKTALQVMLGDKDPENGDYSLYFSRELFIDTNGKHEKVLELLKKDMLEAVVVPENKFDNHCGLKLKYKNEKE